MPLFILERGLSDMKSKKGLTRPILKITRIYDEKRSMLEAFVNVLVREIERRSSVRTFESVKKPEYNEDKLYETEE